MRTLKVVNFCDGVFKANVALCDNVGENNKYILEISQNKRIA
jgi:hypothetical protein